MGSGAILLPGEGMMAEDDGSVSRWERLVAAAIAAFVASALLGGVPADHGWLR